MTSVSDGTPDFLRYPDKQGIGLNQFITIRETQDFDKSILVGLKGKKEVCLSAETVKKDLLSSIAREILANEKVSKR